MSVVERLERLERDARRWRLISGVLACVAGGAITTWLVPNGLGNSFARAQAESSKPGDVDVIEARALRIVREDGSIAASIRALPLADGGATIFAFASPDGLSVIGGRVDNGGPFVDLASKDGEAALSHARIELRPTTQAKTAIRVEGFVSGDPTSEADVQAAPPDSPAISILAHERRGFVGCSNSAGEIVAGMGAAETESGQFFVFDRTGQRKRSLDGE